jgi:hypothetical protein
MNKASLLQRLTTGNPGWEEWNELLALVTSLEFEYVASEYLGNHIVSGSRLTFAAEPFRFPDWLPSYVPALYGMKAAYWENAGGFAQHFNGSLAESGAIFSPAGNDEEFGYPRIDIPAELYHFQSNASGAQFFINKAQQILYPNAEDHCFTILDPMDEFTRKNIQQAVNGREWFDAYPNLKGVAFD